MFKNIFAMLVNTVTTESGDTGYLDQFSWSGPVKGVDAHGRPFFIIPVHVQDEHRYGPGGKVWTQEGTNMVSFFQRYSNDPSIWVTATSGKCGGHLKPVLDGAVRDPDNGSVEELMEKLLKGETVEFFYQKAWSDGTYYKRTARLLSADEVEALKANPRKRGELEA